MNVEDLYRLLRTGHVQAQGIVDTISDPMLVLDESLRVQAASRAFYETFKVGREETIGAFIFDLGNRQWNIPELRVLLSQVIPKSAAVLDYKVEANFAGVGRRTMLLTARTLFHPDNNSHSLLLVIVDATERLQRDAMKDMLFAELQHRMKNLLGVAQAIARLTPTEGRTAEAFRDDFLGRFGALTEAQDLAFAERGETGLGALAERVLSPYAGSSSRVELEAGPRVALSPRLTLSLGLVLHELATNAAKYGALSTPGGKVRIGWTTEQAGGQLRLAWTECGGPPVTPPEKTGYGSQLIQFTTSYSLGGQVEQEFAPEGFRAVVTVPLGNAALES